MKPKTQNLSMCNQTEAKLSTLNGPKSTMSRQKGKVFDRLYNACMATNKGNDEALLQSFKPANANVSFHLNAVYHDSSLFTASLKRVRMKAKIERLKEKE